MVAFFQHKNKSLLYPVSKLDYPAHLHRAVEFGFLEEGCGTLSIEGKNFTLEAGDAFIIFPDCVHLFENCRNVRGFLGIALAEEFPIFEDLFSDGFPASPVIKKDALSSLGIDLLFQSAASDPDLEKDGVLHGYLSVLLGKLLPLLTRERKTFPRQEELRHILMYLEKNFRENLSRRRIAREMGISESSLSHLFSSSMHVSLPTYLTMLRLAEAQRLLTETRLTVTAVANASGFASLRTMNRAFLAHLRKSPTAYRRHLATPIHSNNNKEVSHET